MDAKDEARVREIIAETLTFMSEESRPYHQQDKSFGEYFGWLVSATVPRLLARPRGRTRNVWQNSNSAEEVVK